MNTLLLTCPQNIIDKTTNCCDVKITETICCALITIAVIVAVTILLWHIIDKIAKDCKERRQNKLEESNRKVKIKADYQLKIIDCIKDNPKYKQEYIDKIEQYINDL